jgi:hypothetical protein
MKTLGKLEINSEKIMKNEDLIILRGGYDPNNCCVCALNGIHMPAANAADCDKYCDGLGGGVWNC